MLQLNWFVMLQILSGLYSLGLALYIHNHRQGSGSREFVYLLLALSLFALAAGIESAARSLTAKIIWNVVAYAGHQSAPVLAFLFVLRYTRSRLASIRWLPAVLFLMPTLTLLVAATNSWHGWLWPVVTLTQTAAFGVVADYSHGPWFWLIVAYGYTLLGISNILLLLTMSRFPPVIANQNKIILGAALIPWAANGWYISNVNAGALLDFSPVGFITSSTLLAWALFRHDFLHFTPIGRDVVLDNLKEGILLVDAQRRILAANPAFRSLFGLVPDYRGRPVDTVLSDWPELRVLIDSFGHTPAANSLEIQPVGSPEKWFSIDTVPLPGDEDKVSGFLLAARDITQRKQAEGTLLSRQRFMAILNGITQDALRASDLAELLQSLAGKVGGLIGADAGYITLWDEASQAVTSGYSFVQQGDCPECYAGPDERSMTRAVLACEHALAADDLAASPYLSPEIAARYPLHSLLGLPMIASGRKLGAVLIGFRAPHQFTPQEIALGNHAAAQISLAVLKILLLQEAQNARVLAETNNRHLQMALEHLHQLITTDHLTGAFNRSKFDQQMHHELNRIRRYGQPLAMVIFDIDHFKNVNDRFGHAAGDTVLIELVRLVSKNIREADMLFRWGGEEFIILSPGIELEQAALLGEKIRHMVASHAFSHVPGLTISMGITNVLPGDTPNTLLGRADQALYAAKENGRNRAEVLEAAETLLDAPGPQVTAAA